MYESGAFSMVELLTGETAGSGRHSPQIVTRYIMSDSSDMARSEAAIESEPAARNPIFLVHGIIDRAYIFNSMRAFLEAEGWTVYALDLVPNDGRAGLEVLAQQLADFIDSEVGPERRVDLLGFSMGGLVSRYYVQRLGGLDRVDRFISICAPNHGTLLAFGMPIFKGIRQMCPNSAFLNDLNGNAIEQLGSIDYTSLWTPSDLMILPADSARMPVGRNLEIPAPMHASTVRSARYHKEIAQTLQRPVAPRV